jgi:hypothetical protein
LIFVEPKANMSAGFLRGKHARRNGLQGYQEKILAGGVNQPGFNGFQAVTRSLDFIRPFTVRDEIVLDFSQVNRLA